jgi:EAL domain-containing protein (putative c-di-GMP-specific phosphodiesterase class I)/DNA-binding CsgD family transcriptional regulator
MLDRSLPTGDAADEPPEMRMLVLDDDAATARLLGRIATAAGYAVVITTDAATFHAEYHAAVPDVIMLDLQLGDTDGVEQVRHLASRDYRNALVLISGFDSRVLASARDVATGLGLRVAATLSKPVDVTELRQILTRLRAQAAKLSVERLLQGLADGEMVVEYQPIVQARTRTLGKLEALMRWQHPELGRLEPARFLPLLGQAADAVHVFTDGVIEAATRDYQRLQSLGVTVPIAVNVSPECMLDRGFPDRLERLLLRGGMPPRQLCLEIIETAAFNDPIQSADILARIRLKGVELTIDDFGTGYSSLKLLRQMPFSAIKIDRSFVIDMLSARDCAIIVKTIIDLAQTMDLQSIAEGVETEAAARSLETLGVNFLQGYLTGRPMPVDQVPIWLGAAQRTASVAPPQPLPRTPFEAPYLAKPDLGAADGSHDHYGAVQVQKAAALEAATVHVTTAPAPAGLAKLTPRQQAVIGLVAEGYSIKQMARQLQLGVGTIKTHLSQAYVALGVHNRIDALRRVGLVPTSEGRGLGHDNCNLPTGGIATHA